MTYIIGREGIGLERIIGLTVKYNVHLHSTDGIKSDLSTSLPQLTNLH